MKPGPYLLKGLLAVGVIVAVGVLLAEAPRVRSIVHDADTLRESGFVGGRTVRIDSQSFRGGEAEMVIGKLEVDLRSAAIEQGEAVVELGIAMGAVEFRVPQDWTVDVSEVDAVLAGVENRTDPIPSEEEQRLVLRGTVFMGGLQIRN